MSPLITSGTGIFDPSISSSNSFRDPSAYRGQIDIKHELTGQQFSGTDNRENERTVDTNRYI